MSERRPQVRHRDETALTECPYGDVTRPVGVLEYVLLACSQRQDQGQDEDRFASLSPESPNPEPAHSPSHRNNVRDYARFSLFVRDEAPSRMASDLSLRELPEKSPA